jgi:hypothetical protein
MTWTALDRDGNLARIDGRTVTFPDGATATLPVDPYTPVFAADEVGGLLVYRETDPADNHKNSVRFAASTGEQGVLADQCEGKWPLAIRRLAPGRFEVAWINRGVNVSSVTMAEIRLAPLEVVSLGQRAIPPAMILMAIDEASGTIRVDATDGGYDVTAVTRGGQTRPLIHWTENAGRVVGADGADGAPNRLLLADTDGWYVVSDVAQTVLFPAQLDDAGHVACYPGLYFTNADIRTRPLTATPGPIVTPAPPVVPPPPAPADCTAEKARIAALTEELSKSPTWQEWAKWWQFVFDSGGQHPYANAGELRAAICKAWGKVEQRAAAAEDERDARMTPDQVLKLVNDATGQMAGYWRYLGVQGAVDRAVKAELAKRKT